MHIMNQIPCILKRIGPLVSHPFLFYVQQRLRQDVVKNEEKKNENNRSVQWESIR